MPHVPGIQADNSWPPDPIAIGGARMRRFADGGRPRWWQRPGWSERGTLVIGNDYVRFCSDRPGERELTHAWLSDVAGVVIGLRVPYRCRGGMLLFAVWDGWCEVRTPHWRDAVAAQQAIRERHGDPRSSRGRGR